MHRGGYGVFFGVLTGNRLGHLARKAPPSRQYLLTARLPRFSSSSSSRGSGSIDDNNGPTFVPPPPPATPSAGWGTTIPVPQRPGASAGIRSDIPVKPRVPLTQEEVVAALDANGAVDVRVVNLEGKSTLCEAMIFCTGLSGRHMRRLSDTISRALKKRKLLNAPGRTGAEGREGSDWHVVDCWNLIVHVMDADTRRELDLETTWEMMEIPQARQFGEGYVEDPPGPPLLRGRKRRPWEIREESEEEGVISLDDDDFDIIRAATEEEERQAYQEMLGEEMEAAKEAARRRKPS